MNTSSFPHTTGSRPDLASRGLAKRLLKTCLPCVAGPAEGSSGADPARLAKSCHGGPSQLRSWSFQFRELTAVIMSLKRSFASSLSISTVRVRNF